MGELRSVVDALAVVDPAELDAVALGALLVEVTEQTDRLVALRARLTGEHDRRGAWKSDGARSQKDWLVSRCRLTPGEAGGRVELARRLVALPATADAAVAGAITAAQAKTAAAAARDLPADAVAGLDRLVAQTGPTVDPGQLRAAVDGYAHRVAAESLAGREQRAWNNRRLTLSRTAEGAVAVDGRLDQLGGEVVQTALAPLAAPAGPDDTRTPDQRRADALVTLCRRALDTGDLPDTGGQRPHVTVVVPLETLQQRPGTAPATLDRTGVISGETARLLACDASITRVITSGASQPLDVGRASRVVTPAQRKALAVRDKGCVGCPAPTAWCEAHHVRHWADRGPTDLANLILVCWACHRGIHDRGWTPTRAPDGTWTLRRPKR